VSKSVGIPARRLETGPLHRFKDWPNEQVRQLGNFPRAFSHVALVNTANYLSESPLPAWARHIP